MKTALPLIIDLNLEYSNYVKPFTIIDKILDTKWKQQRRREILESYIMNDLTQKAIYKYHMTKNMDGNP